MNEKSLPIAMIFLSFLIAGTILLMQGVYAIEEIQDCAVIIVSSYDPDNNEHEKAERYYSYLIDQGLDEDRVIFLSFNVSGIGVDGYSNISGIGSAFSEIEMLCTSCDRLSVYISDHVPPPMSNSSHFVFIDGNITFSDMDDVMGSIESSHTDIYVGGIHSGRSGNHLRGGDRTVICSMKGYQDIDPDQFALVRGLEDPTSDTNNDGKVSFVEAYWKEVENLSGTGQDPVLLI
ncbi:MAG: hypothetical protein QCI82_09485 [Candidatus Thermoplasmatota archaeon]|nr:hypothetical protein [Candidatus Thermoplasmatota archaeon]